MSRPFYVYRIEKRTFPRLSEVLEEARDSEVAGPFWTVDAAEDWIQDYIDGDDALDEFDIRLESGL